jgi:hypothetical protein
MTLPRKQTSISSENCFASWNVEFNTSDLCGTASDASFQEERSQKNTLHRSEKVKSNCRMSRLVLT